MSTSPAPGPSLRVDHAQNPEIFPGRSGDRESCELALPPSAGCVLGRSLPVARFRVPGFLTGRSKDRKVEILGLAPATGGVRLVRHDAAFLGPAWERCEMTGRVSEGGTHRPGRRTRSLGVAPPFAPLAGLPTSRELGNREGATRGEGPEASSRSGRQREPQEFSASLAFRSSDLPVRKSRSPLGAGRDAIRA